MMETKILKKRRKSCFEPHDHEKCVANALFAAEEICKAKNLRLTDLRFAVLEKIWRSDTPVGAYEILDALKNDFPKAAPISIYRALDFLEENSLIHKLPAEGSFVGCRFPEEEHTPVFLVCSICKKAEEIKIEKNLKELKKAAASVKFKPKKACIELYGVCPSCRN